jgi:hypothetical protein
MNIERERMNMEEKTKNLILLGAKILDKNEGKVANSNLF